MVHGPRGLFFRPQGSKDRSFENKHIETHWFCCVNQASLKQLWKSGSKNSPWWTTGHVCKGVKGACGYTCTWSSCSISACFYCAAASAGLVLETATKRTALPDAAASMRVCTSYMLRSLLVWIHPQASCYDRWSRCPRCSACKHYNISFWKS